jgi:hypothetical protein
MLKCAQNDLQFITGSSTICGVIVEGNVKVIKGKDDGANKLVKNLMEGKMKH